MLVQNRQNRNGLFGAIRNYCDLLYLFMFLLPGEKFTEKLRNWKFSLREAFYSNRNTNIIFAVLKNRVINFYRKSCLGWFVDEYTFEHLSHDVESSCQLYEALRVAKVNQSGYHDNSDAGSFNVSWRRW